MCSKSDAAPDSPPTRPHDSALTCEIKSSLSYANGGCVQVARLAGGRIGVRHSKDPAGPVLRFTPAEWAAFTGGAACGEFTDLPPAR
jgi:Domain of unknown function (DUF397)